MSMDRKLATKKEIAAELLRTNPELMEKDGFDTHDYVSEFVIKKDSVYPGARIYVVAVPTKSGRTGYLQGILNAISGSSRKKDFAVEKSSVYAMYPVSEISCPVPSIMERGYSKRKSKGLKKLPDKGWKEDYMIIERDFGTLDSTEKNISDSVSYLSGILSGLKGMTAA